MDDRADAGSRSERTRRRVERLPAGQRRTVVLGSVVLLLGAAHLGTVLVAAALLEEDPDWLRPIPGLAGSFAGAFLAVRWQRRRLGGASRLREFRGVDRPVVAVTALVWVLGEPHSARIERLAAQLPADR